MNTMTEIQLDEVFGGGDSLAKDLGQLVGGIAGWMQGNYLAYLLLGPGVGGVVAFTAGLSEAEL
jgi:hypothetical protein